MTIKEPYDHQRALLKSPGNGGLVLQRVVSESLASEESVAKYAEKSSHPVHLGVCARGRVRVRVRVGG